jgi:hypothetical protein
VGLTDISLTPTHDVTDGMVSAIIKATKPASAPPTLQAFAPAAGAELPLATSGSCCGGTGCC